MTIATPANWSELYRSDRFGQVVLLSFGIWLHAADERMVSTITPALTAEIGGERYVAWLIGLYEVGSIIAGALGALLVLQFGLRRCMAAGAFVYLAGCLLSGLSPSISQMLAGRFVQGMGGGAMVAFAFVAVHRLFSGRLFARVIALISVVWGVSAFVGPLIGAAFAQYGHWRGAFFFLALQAAGFGLLALLRLRDDDAEIAAVSEARAIFAMMLRVVALGAGVVAIAASGVEESAPKSFALVAIGAVLIGLFLMLDGRAGKARLLPTKAFDPRTIAGSTLVGFLFMSACTSGLITYGPLLLTRLHGLDPVAIGIILLLESVGWSVVAVAIAGLPEKHESAAILGGFLMVLASVAGLYWVVPTGPMALVAACAFVQGGGFGAAWTFMVKRAVALVPAGETDRISSAIPTTQRLGYALGAAYVGIIANSSGFAEQATAQAAAHSSNWIFGLSLVPAVIGLLAMTRLVFTLPDNAG